MLPAHFLKVIPSDMRSLHERVLYLEDHLLSMKTPSYPVFTVKVPRGMGFFDRAPYDVFFLRFDEIFNMFHLKRLDRNFVRLVALSMSNQVMREGIPGIAIIDPYPLYESLLADPHKRVWVIKYVQEFLAANKEKEMILVPYFPE